MDTKLGFSSELKKFLQLFHRAHSNDTPTESPSSNRKATTKRFSELDLNSSGRRNIDPSRHMEEFRNDL